MNCARRFQDLVRDRDAVLEEDLAALKRRNERERIELYNTIKSDEATFKSVFTGDCRDFLTQSERDRARGEFQLARLLVAASFDADDEGDLPPAMADDFADAALEAVVDFERFKRFDALSAEQIEAHIRRMDGEVYELVTEYTSTQLATVEELLESPEIQQELVERLLTRYEERREKIRQGFFTYVETHGLEHMVTEIAAAVEAVAAATDTRETVREQRQGGLENVSVRLDGSLHRRTRTLESELGAAEAGLGGTDETDVEQLREQAADLTETQRTAASELQDQLEETTDLEDRIDAEIERLRQLRKDVADADREETADAAADLVDTELGNLEAERDELRAKVDQLERERERLEAARSRLDERQETLDGSGGGDANAGTGTGAESGLDGDDVVTASVARLQELDYLGRFDISMRDAPTITTDASGDAFEVPDGYWDGRSERRNERTRLADLLEDPDPATVEQYPVNRSARYEITASQYFGLASETELVIEARVCTHLSAYAATGFDAAPADLDDLLSILNDVIYEAEQQDLTYLIGLASPTGWTDRVIEQLQGEGQNVARTRVSQNVSVCLVDLQDGSVLYDESDPVVAENAHLFEPPLEDDRVADCVETLRDEYVDNLGCETVLLCDIVDRHDYDPHIIDRAFDELEGDGHGEQFYVDDLGLTLDVGV